MSGNVSLMSGIAALSVRSSTDGERLRHSLSIASFPAFCSISPQRPISV
nr:MAG TPA: hypothetical protein [Caudoviricetes sp.]